MPSPTMMPTPMAAPPMASQVRRPTISRRTSQPSTAKITTNIDQVLDVFYLTHVEFLVNRSKRPVPRQLGLPPGSGRAVDARTTALVLQLTANRQHGVPDLLGLQSAHVSAPNQFLGGIHF